MIKIKILKNVPLTRYCISENKTIIPDDVMRRCLEDFKEKPIVKDNKVIGVIVSADDINTDEKIVYGTIALYGEDSCEQRYAMSIQCDDYENKDDIMVINAMKMMSIDVIQ